MAEYGTVRSGTAGIRTAEIDQGLRAHMNKVYGLMSAALLVSFAIGYTISASPSLMQLVFGTPLFYAVVFGPLAFVLVANFAFHRLSVAAINGIFWAYAALTGASLAIIFAMFSMTSILSGLLFTSVAFLGSTMGSRDDFRQMLATVVATGLTASPLAARRAPRSSDRGVVSML